MDKKQKKNFTITVWDGMNKFLAAATAVTTIIFTILFIFVLQRMLAHQNMVLFLVCAAYLQAWHLLFLSLGL